MTRDKIWGRGTSPLGLGGLAAGIAVAFALVHLVGLRDYTVVFSGASPAGGPATLLEVAGGVSYVVLFLSLVAVAPILLLAAVIFVGLQVLAPGEPAPQRKAP